ncbi:MAG: 30S ribosomal protein S30e [Thermoprotei archaeon]|nr:MAG: 30S ribosomal protein S30e [Thermoprotei archaeon]
MPSHGSLTKAGKVRSQTPKIPPRPRTRPHPRVGFRKRYFRRVVYPSIMGSQTAA